MDLENLISNYWDVAISIGGVVWSYATLKSQNNSQEKRLAKVESQIEAMNPIFLQIQKDLVEIKTELRFMGKQLNDNSHKLGLN